MDELNIIETTAEETATTVEETTGLATTSNPEESEGLSGKAIALIAGGAVAAITGAVFGVKKAAKALSDKREKKAEEAKILERFYKGELVPATNGETETEAEPEAEVKADVEVEPEEPTKNKKK